MSLHKVKCDRSFCADRDGHDHGKSANYIDHHPVQKDVSADGPKSPLNRDIIVPVPISSTRRWAKGIISQVIGEQHHINLIRVKPSD